MVFVAVRQNDGAHGVAVLLQVGDVGDDDVHAKQFGFGKHHPGIDHDQVVAVAQGQHVHAELAQAAQRNGPQGRLTHCDGKASS